MYDNTVVEDGRTDNRCTFFLSKKNLVFMSFIFFLSFRYYYTIFLACAAIYYYIILHIYNTRPNEPHLSTVLQNKGLSSNEVNNIVLPVWTYTYCVSLLVGICLAEYLRYLPVIYIGLICRITSRLCLIFGSNIIAFQIMQALYAIGKT